MTHLGHLQDQYDLPLQPLPPRVLLCSSGHLTPEWCQIASGLREALNEGKLALVVGSGISQFQPSNAPFAAQIAVELREQLISQLPGEIRHRFRAGTDGMPFEVLLGRLSEIEPSIARAAVVRLTELGKCNDLHRHIARLLLFAANANVSLVVVTSNYDEGIELALRDEVCGGSFGAKVPTVVTTERDLKAIKPDGCEVFHVHGALSCPSSLVLDYSQEFRLGRWRRDHLLDLLDEKTVLVIGFSGWDLDVSRVIAQAKPFSITWMRRNATECEEPAWSVDARRAMERKSDRLFESAQVDTGGELGLVIPSVLQEPGTRLQDPCTDSCGTRISRVRDMCGPNVMKIWARWTAVRAGFATAADDVPKEQMSVLDRSRALDLRAFGDYYRGQHRTAAWAQSVAARTSLRDDNSLATYIYHRNNMVEYLNRGGYSWLAITELVKSVVAVSSLLATRRRRIDSEAVSEFRNLVASVAFVWPAPALYLLSLRWHRVIVYMLAPVAQFVLGADMDKHLTILAAAAGPGSAEYRGAEWRYNWLGQRARTINLQRIAAYQSLRMFRLHGSHADLEQAEFSIERAMAGARLINDPCRLGKTRLLQLEVQRCAGGEVNADEVRSAWTDLAQGELSKGMVFVARLLYVTGSLLGSRGTNWRLTSLACLETS